MDDLNSWLTGLGLGKYVETFVDNEIGIADLGLLTDEDMKALGIPLGPRRRLQNALAVQSALHQPASEKRQPDSPLPGERRQVTVLFADMSNFTTMSSELDPEELHSILNRYFDVVDGIIQRYGGRIDKHIGDSVMALFGAPIARTNDPERAVKAALDIHAAMPALSQSVGREISAHIGVASGAVVASGTGSEAYREYTVTGETVNLASRLGDIAGPGETLVSDSVHTSVSSIFKCVNGGELPIKGLTSPARTWIVEALAADGAVRHSNVLVGRRMEQRQFAALAQECEQSGRGCCVLVRGDPGIGKTRLVEEFVAEATRNGFVAVRGLVLDFGATKENEAIGSLIRGLLNIQLGDSHAQRQEMLNRAIDRGDLSEASRLFANQLLDLPLSTELRDLYSEMDKTAREAGSCAVLSDLVSSCAARAPLLLVVEDIHWADQFTLDHLSHLARTIATQRVMLAMTTRIEGASMLQSWAGFMSGSPLTAIELQPLREEEARALVAVLGQDEPELVAQMVERSGGNPLFLELLARNVCEPGAGRLPDTLQGLVMARIDRLPQRDKEALQAGSVVGQKLSVGLLRHLISDPSYDCRTLLEHRLLKPDGDAYLFEHAVIRDGVYESLLHTQRRALHRRAAEWFASTDPILHAEHLERAADPAAAEAYLAAAQAEADNHRAEKALGLADRGLGQDPSADALFSLSCLRGQLLENLNRFEESTSVFRAALPIAPSEAGQCRALLGLALASIRLDRLAEAEKHLQEAETISVRCDLKEAAALIHRRRATIEFARGNSQASFEESKIALRMAEECGLSLLRAEALSCMADAEAANGKFVSARSYYDQCIELCRANGFRRFAIINMKMLGDNAFYRGELPASRHSFGQVVEEAAVLGDLRSEVLARNMLVYLDCLAGKAEEAIRQAKQVREQILRINIRRFLMNNHCLIAMAYRINGQSETALAHLRDAEVLASELGVTWALPWVLGEKALALSDVTERETCLDEGMALLAAGHGGYFTFEFYRPAIDATLQSGNWLRAERLCNDFASSMGNEPVGLPEYVITRARAILSAMQGRGDRETLAKIRDHAVGMELRVDLPLIDIALAA